MKTRSQPVSPRGFLSLETVPRRRKPRATTAPSSSENVTTALSSTTTEPNAKVNKPKAKKKGKKRAPPKRKGSQPETGNEQNTAPQEQDVPLSDVENIPPSTYPTTENYRGVGGRSRPTRGPYDIPAPVAQKRARSDDDGSPEDSRPVKRLQTIPPAVARVRSRPGRPFSEVRRRISSPLAPSSAETTPAASTPAETTTPSQVEPSPTVPSSVDLRKKMRRLPGHFPGDTMAEADLEPIDEAPSESLNQVEARPSGWSLGGILSRVFAPRSQPPEVPVAAPVNPEPREEPVVAPVNPVQQEEPVQTPINLVPQEEPIQDSVATKRKRRSTSGATDFDADAAYLGDTSDKESDVSSPDQETPPRPKKRVRFARPPNHQGPWPPFRWDRTRGQVREPSSYGLYYEPGYYYTDSDCSHESITESDSSPVSRPQNSSVSLPQVSPVAQAENSAISSSSASDVSSIEGDFPRRTRPSPNSYGLFYDSDYYNDSSSEGEAASPTQGQGVGHDGAAVSPLPRPSDEASVVDQPVAAPVEEGDSDIVMTDVSPPRGEDLPPVREEDVLANERAGQQHRAAGLRLTRGWAQRPIIRQAPTFPLLGPPMPARDLDPIAKARWQAERYKPRLPSGLRASKRYSASPRTRGEPEPNDAHGVPSFQWPQLATLGGGPAVGGQLAGRVAF